MGMKIGLSYTETMARTQGELMDMFSCYLIAQGVEEKFTYSKNNFMDLMRMK